MKLPESKGMLLIVFVITMIILFGILGIGTLLWAYYAPMFNLPVLSYWQFIGLWILTSILFKGISVHK